MGGKDKMGPMFPRLHINDSEKGGPRAPPRNKMALYEQLTIPSQRSTHSIQMPQRHPSETQYSRHSDLTTPSPQAEAKKKLDEDDFIVPIFTHSVPIKNPNLHINNTSQEGVSPSYSPFFHRSSKSQTAGVLEHNSVTHEGETNTTELEEEKIYSSDPRKALSSDPQVVCDLNDDSDSETSILDVVCEPDMTPDYIVGVIGQKRFWKARRAIVNQQRVFSVQVFELHRLVEVQKLIAASPHLLTLPSDFTLKAATLDDPKKRKALFEKSPEIESSTENSVEKKSSSPHSYPNDHLIRRSPSPLSIASSINRNNTINPYPDQPQGHQWLVPFMSPFEGLVYRPYPGPTGPPAPQYHVPPHGYFPPYAMPMMNTFSSRFSGRCNESRPVSEDVGVQVSTASNGVENVHPVRADGGPELNMRACGSEGPSRVIKAVARNGLSASESAARIFRSIQEERRQC